MIVSKTISIEFDDLVEVQDRIKIGEVQSLSEFVQKAIKNELERWFLNVKLEWKTFGYLHGL